MKLNPEYALFDGNMFVQMRSLLADIDLPSGTDMLDMSIGEPQIAGGDLLTGSIISPVNPPPMIATSVFTAAPR